MGEVEVVNPLSGDGKLYKNMNIKLKSEKEEEKSLILESMNKYKTLKKFSKILLELIITACAGSAVKKIKTLENGSILIKTRNKEQAKNLVTLVNIGSLYEVRVTECDEAIENETYEKRKLRDSTSRQKMASVISLMSGDENMRANVDESKNTQKFHEKFLSSLLNARQRRGKVGTYFLTFVKAEPPDVNAKNRW
jgi:hypothetical protein